MPLHPDHAASFMGDTLRLTVAMANVKAPIVTHTNAYVGHLRHLVRPPMLRTPYTITYTQVRCISISDVINEEVEGRGM